MITPLSSLAFVALLASPAVRPYLGPFNPWAEVATPTERPARSYGGTSQGCLDGGVPLPPNPSHYNIVGAQQNRFYGHPEMIAFVGRLAARLTTARAGRFDIGDLSQPRGGPMPGDHASHQTGLDADIYYTLRGDKMPAPTRSELARYESIKVVDEKSEEIDRARFTPGVLRLLEAAAIDDAVDRIFVHASVKREACVQFGDAEWLRKLRPWWYHFEHMHVRLACPKTSPECVSQDPIEPGTGCGSDLARWFTDEMRAGVERTLYENNLHKPAALPAACSQVLSSE